MKIILSRKGFDSKYGGIPSPIFPDGRLLSLPIPNKEDLLQYTQIRFTKDLTYYDLLRQLYHSIKIKPHHSCHLDPDLKPSPLPRKQGWRSLFGQINNAQSHLSDQGVLKGDLFVFFGTFAHFNYEHGEWHYEKPRYPMHMFFGYLQIDEIRQINRGTQVETWMRDHPHVSNKDRLTNPRNTLYIARRRLSWDPRLSGGGMFQFHPDLILTKPGYSKSQWELPSLFRNVKISHHTSASWHKDYFQSVPIGQEFVVQDHPDVEEWVKSLVSAHSTKDYKH